MKLLFKHTIPSDLNFLSIADDIASELSVQIGLTENQHFELRLVLNESITNAIVHGNSNDPSKFVTITCALEQDALFIAIGDEGCGFDWELIPDPTQRLDLEQEGGRGVFLMKKLCYNLSYNYQKNEFTFYYSL